MLMFSRSDVVDVILDTIEWDKTRGGHTVDSVVTVLTRMGIVTPYDRHPSWTPLQIRLTIARLIEVGRLDMRPNGVLILPDESPDPLIECFDGSYYVTLTNGPVKGPFKSASEANDYVVAIRSEGQPDVSKPLGSPAR